MALQPVIKTNRDPVGVFGIRSGKSSSATILVRMNTYLTALFGLEGKVALLTVRRALGGSNTMRSRQKSRVGGLLLFIFTRCTAGQILKKLSQSPTRLLLQPFPHHQVSLMGKMNFGEVAFDTQKFANIIVGNLAKTPVRVQELALHGKKHLCAYRHYIYLVSFKLQINGFNYLSPCHN